LQAKDEYLSKRVPLNFSIEKARRIQQKISERIVTEDRLPSSLDLVAGIDISYVGGSAAASVAVLKYDTLEVVEVKRGRVKERFPYVPTLLLFREAPAVFRVLQKIEMKPDVYLIDAHGLAHPYRCGLASYVGVIKRIPTIGVAKSRLCGDVGEHIDDVAPLVENGETIGVELITKHGERPVYVSVGNMVSLSRSIEVVRHCTKNYRIPEPLRIAHEKATKEKLCLN